MIAPMTVRVGDEEFPMRDLFASEQSVFQQQIDAVTSALQVTEFDLLRRAETLFNQRLQHRFSKSQNLSYEKRVYPAFGPEEFMKVAATGWADADKSLWMEAARRAYLNDAINALGGVNYSNVPCPHPDPFVTYTHGANTGGWSTNGDRYWTDFHCHACLKSWRMEETYNPNRHSRYGLDESTAV